MQPENFDIESLDESRRQSLEETIKPVSFEELKALGEKLFPYLDHPWRDLYFNFIKENAGSTFYHATAPEKLEIIYCRDMDKGLWFVSGKGVGPLQAKGLSVMKEIVKGRP